MTNRILLAVSLLFFFTSPILKADEADPTSYLSIPELESSNGEDIGPYRALSEWTKLSPEERVMGVMKEGLVPSKDPISGQTTLWRAEDIINGDFGLKDTVAPFQAIKNAQAANTSGSTLELRKDSIGVSQPWSSTIVITLSCLVLAFGIAILISGAYMARHGFKPYTIIRFNGLVLVVVSSVMLVLVGYSQEQISPVIGLLGAIAGYLLGNKGNDEAHSKPKIP